MLMAKLLTSNDAIYRVLLPLWIREQATDNEQYMKMIIEYMDRYPNYSVKKIKDGFAICERRD